MDSMEDHVDKTILNTPKPTATSTVDRKSYQRKNKRHGLVEDSLEVPHSESMDKSKIQESYKHLKLLDVSYDLQQQRSLAENSLQRVNNVIGIPSKYLRPNLTSTKYETLKGTNESTVNESDLLRTPTNTSTPRNSLDVNNLRESMAKLSYKISKSDISIDNFPKEFQKALEASHCSIPNDSNLFIPAEEARSLFLADELSWYKHNDIPIMGEQFSNLNVASNVSMGDFFQKKSDTLSDFPTSRSPEKNVEPIPLISFTSDFNTDSLDYLKVETMTIPVEQNTNYESKKHESLSVSAIQRFLTETEDTPRKVVDYLLSHAKRSSTSSKIEENTNEPLSLPFSKNSSYTSDHSDNEALRCIVNKENVDYLNVCKPMNSRASSQVSRSTRSSSRSSSTITSLPNGKLPIETSKCELIWGCVKIDKCVTLDFLLRNRTAKKLGLQMSVSGHEYKIKKDNRIDTELFSSSKILLYPYEAKNIIVSFIPTRIGAAVDELVFTSLDPNLQHTSKQCVRLFGYGGYNKIEFYDLTKDINQKFWLSFGKFNNSMSQKNFTVKNTGVLPSFVHISYKTNDFFNVVVTPNFFTLIPQEEKEIIVAYKPTLEDHSTLLKSTTINLVADLGSLIITSGAEVTRGRLRRLCRKNEENGLKVDSLSNILRGHIKGEVMPADLSKFRENADTLGRIVRLFNHNEVILTIERDPDQTIIPHYMDESGMFHSLCHDTTVLNLENTTVHSYLLEPTMVFLMPPVKVKDCFFLRSGSSQTVNYQVMSHPEGLEIDPKEGSLTSGGKVILSIRLPEISVFEDKQYKICVYIENEVLEAHVKVALVS